MIFSRSLAVALENAMSLRLNQSMREFGIPCEGSLLTVRNIREDFARLGPTIDIVWFNG